MIKTDILCQSATKFYNAQKILQRSEVTIRAEWLDYVGSSHLGKDERKTDVVPSLKTNKSGYIKVEMRFGNWNLN